MLWVAPLPANRHTRPSGVTNASNTEPTLESGRGGRAIARGALYALSTSAMKKVGPPLVPGRTICGLLNLFSPFAGFKISR